MEFRMKHKQANNILKGFEMAIQSKCQPLLKSLLADTSYTYWFRGETKLSEKLYALQARALELLY
jgi:hypothetical protein